MTVVLVFLYFHQFLFYHKSQFKKSNKIVGFFKDAYIWVNPISSLSPDLDLDEDTLLSSTCIHLDGRDTVARIQQSVPLSHFPLVKNEL